MRKPIFWVSHLYLSKGSQCKMVVVVNFFVFLKFDFLALLLLHVF